jgi:protein-disulfide isomerase
MRNEVETSEIIRISKSSGDIFMGKNKKIKNKPTKWKLTWIVILLCVAVIAGIQVYKKIFGNTFGPVHSSRTQGNRHAPIKVVEYIDLQCPACVEGSRQLQKYIEEHPDRIYWEIRHFPLSNHKNSFRAAIYSECAGHQNKFWPFTVQLLEEQAQWKALVDVDLAFEKIAQETGLNVTELHECIKDQMIAGQILQEKQKSEESGIQSTPTYFINGKMGVGNDFLKQEMEARLRKKSK